eukprot:m.58398 g.58398  ORF g.58398 m.58398 type:complete len:329 (+) comp13761_c0_seq1:1605-2591(+)
MEWLASALGIEDARQPPSTTPTDATAPASADDGVVAPKVPAAVRIAPTDCIEQMPQATPISRPEELQSSGQLTADQLLHHFKTFKEAIESPQAHARLLLAHESKGVDIADEAEMIRRECFQDFGIDGKFGIKAFRTIKRDFKTHREVLLAFQESLELETLALDRIELPPEEFAKRHDTYKSLKAQQDLVLNMVPQLQSVMADPNTAFLLHAKADAHHRQQGGVDEDPQQTLARAMRKLAFARKQMSDNDIDEKMIFSQAMQLIQDPEFLQEGEQVTQQPTAQSMPSSTLDEASAATPTQTATATSSLSQGLTELTMNDVSAAPKDKGA